ncbi:MAG: UDP-N-acetylmuramate--L-alanine ligase [Bacteroidales bacterium]|jgi:UDP-N-acetylmuramate--alanine ligase|nr:UDP-N-acetylmuramate--L-alanine ligase [Bacteroidales bacterium]
MDTLLSDIKQVYFLGIGGIGMSALARYFHKQGTAVSGYDKTPSPLIDEMIQEGISVHFDDDVSQIPQNLSMAVYTPAVPKTNKNYLFLEKSDIPFLKRSQVLGLLTEKQTTFAVSGTHGKTSTTAIAAQLLSASKKITAFVGGIALNFNSNLISDGNEIMLVEADEYDRSFLHLYPDVAVITAMDADHLDIYGTDNEMLHSFNDFANNIKENGTLIIKKSLTDKINTHATVKTYSVEDKSSDYYARNIHIQNRRYYFDIVTPQGVIVNVSFGAAGMHNVENAIAACAMSDIAGVDHSIIRTQLISYMGVKRRFEYIINRNDFAYIDDYAHHPEEIKACIAAAKMMHRGKKICGIFQPHLYSRTRDFADAFARSLEELDHVILLDIYPARELPIPGVTSKMLLQKINKTDKILVNDNQLLQYLEIIKPEVLLTMGAGDIDRLVGEIKKMFSHD